MATRLLQELLVLPVDDLPAEILEKPLDLPAEVLFTQRPAAPGAEPTEPDTPSREPTEQAAPRPEPTAPAAPDGILEASAPERYGILQPDGRPET